MRMCFGPVLIAALPSATVADARHAIGQPFRDRRFAPEMVVVPAGVGVIGSTEAETIREARTPAFAAFEHPQRTVKIDRPFGIATHHVTNAEFAAFVKATQRDMAGCIVLRDGTWSETPDPAASFASPGWSARDDEPVVCVNWADASAYAAWLNAKTGAAYRLPSEAEWEYAARAGTVSARWWGDGRDDICTRANGGDRDYAAIMPGDKSANLACSDGFAQTSPVGRYRASPWGLHDMYGNAWQWTADCFAGDCTKRAIRGGSWHNSIATLRSATRFSLPATMRSSSLGFRVVRDMETKR